MGKYDLQNDNSSLEQLKTDLTNINNKFDKAAEYLKTAQTNLANNYSLNDSANKTVARLADLEKKIRERKENISKNVIPSIDSKISSNNAEIARIEAEERAAEEAAARAAAEAAAQAEQEAEEAAAAEETTLATYLSTSN